MSTKRFPPPVTKFEPSGTPPPAPYSPPVAGRAVQARPAVAIPPVRWPSPGRGAAVLPRPSGAILPKVGPPARTVQRADRHDTIYTHTHTKPHNQLTGTPQGPHTVAFSLVSHGFTQSTVVNDWDMLEAVFIQQVPTLTQVEQIIDRELPGKLTTRMKASLKRYLENYGSLYDEIEKALASKTDYNGTAAKIRQIMELHPFQTYAWKTPRPASHRSTRGKGEGHYLRDWLGGDGDAIWGLLDLGRAKFHSSEDFWDFVRTRLELVMDPDDIEKLLA